MNHRYLEVTFRNGKPVAAYFYLPRRISETSARTERHEGGLLVDFSPDGEPIGIEITAPGRFSLNELNRALAAVNQEPANRDELGPLAAA